MESCVVCLLEKQRYQQNPIQNFHAPRGATLRTTLLRAFHPPHLGEWRPLAVEERSVSWEEGSVARGKSSLTWKTEGNS